MIVYEPLEHLPSQTLNLPFSTPLRHPPPLCWWQYRYSPLAGLPSLETSESSGVAEDAWSAVGGPPAGLSHGGCAVSDPAPTLRVSASSERLPSAGGRRRVNALFLKIMSCRGVWILVYSSAGEREEDSVRGNGVQWRRSRGTGKKLD